MSPIETGTVLVTGAAGFLGSHGVAALLDAGFKVRATARSATKGEMLKSLFPGHEERIETVVVEDMTKPGAYDEAVVGVDGLLHVASPMDLTGGDMPTIAAAGVTGILKSLAEHNPTAQRVVQMSSIASIGSAQDKSQILDEKTWAEQSITDFENLPKDAPADKSTFWIQYKASKTIAERAFWSFIEKEKPGFDGVAILPALTYGPPVNHAPGAEVPSTMKMFIAYLNPTVEIPDVDVSNIKAQTGYMVDVRDVAHACAAAFKSGKAGGERYLLAAAPLFGNDFAVAVTKAVPSLGLGNNDPKFKAALDAEASKYDATKATNTFNFVYRDKDETMEEAAKTVVEMTKPKV